MQVMADESDDPGGAPRQYTDEDFLQVLEEEDEPRSTSEIAKKVGCHRNSALQRLKELEECGEVTMYDRSSGYLWVRAKK